MQVALASNLNVPADRVGSQPRAESHDHPIRQHEAVTAPCMSATCRPHVGQTWNAGIVFAKEVTHAE